MMYSPVPIVRLPSHVDVNTAAVETGGARCLQAGVLACNAYGRPAMPMDAFGSLAAQPGGCEHCSRSHQRMVQGLGAWC